MRAPVHENEIATQSLRDDHKSAGGNSGPIICFPEIVSTHLSTTQWLGGDGSSRAKALIFTRTDVSRITLDNSATEPHHLREGKNTHSYINISYISYRQRCLSRRDCRCRECISASRSRTQELGMSWLSSESLRPLFSPSLPHERHPKLERKQMLC